MAYCRGDIIEVYLDLPNLTDFKPHPFIIISNEDVYDTDRMYIAVMMTHLEEKDKFTFVIEDDMLVKGGDGKFSQARCHLVINVKDEHIIKNKNFNSMKQNAVDRLVSRIQIVSLSKL